MWILLFVLLFSSSAFAAEGVGSGHGITGQTLPKSCGFIGTDSRGVITCSGGTGGGGGGGGGGGSLIGFTPQAVINPVDYGAKCDGVTDDAPAINLAINALRTAGQGKFVFPANGTCLVNSSLNFTAIQQKGTVIDGAGAILKGALTPGGPIGTVANLVAGSGYTPGTYTGIALLGGTGTGATGTVLVGSGSDCTAGTVCSVTMISAAGSGTHYLVGDILTANIAGGSGFTVQVVSVSSGAIIDALGTRYLRFTNLNVQGDCTSIPNIGMQIGHAGTFFGVADNITIDGFRFAGCFRLTDLLNEASEGFESNATNLWNDGGGSDVDFYGLINDGQNHWNIASDFITVTAAINTSLSFNSVNMNSLDIRVNGNPKGTCIWMARGFMHAYYNSYCANSNHGVAYFSDSSTRINIYPHFDMHFETTSMTDVFYMTGGNKFSPMLGLYYADALPQPNNSVFKIDPAMTSPLMQLTGATVKISSISGNPKLFDDASAWTVQFERLELPGKTSLWADNYPTNIPSTNTLNLGANTLTSGAGSICIGFDCDLLVATSAINRNPDFTINQPLEVSAVTVSGNAIVTDGWRIGYDGTASSIFAINGDTTFPYNRASVNQSHLAMAMVTPHTPGAADKNLLFSQIEGPDMAQFNWGQQNPAFLVPYSMMMEFCVRLKAGTYSFFLQNRDANRSYVFQETVTAGAYNCFGKKIPADVGGTWSATLGSVGLKFGISMGSGSNYQTTADSWQAGEFYEVPGSTQIVADSAGSLTIGYFRIRRTAIPGLPYKQKPVSQQLIEARRYFQKSTPLGTRPKTNAGLTGATCVQNTTANGLPGAYVQFSPQMVGTPTVTTYNPSVASVATWRDVTTSTNVAVTVDPIGAIGPSGVQINAAAVAAAGDNICIHWSADSGF